MSKKNNALSEENLGQVAGGAICINDDGSVTLTGINAEKYLDHRARKRLRKHKDSSAVEGSAAAPSDRFDGCMVAGPSDGFDGCMAAD